jgi:acyl carrier protein
MRNLSEQAMMSTEHIDDGKALAEVIDLLRAHFAHKLAEQVIGRETHLTRDLGLDSMDLLSLVAAIENAYGQPIALDDDQDLQISTVGAMAAVVERMHRSKERDDASP